MKKVGVRRRTRRHSKNYRTYDQFSYRRGHDKQYYREMLVLTLKSSFILFAVLSVEALSIKKKEPRGPIQEALQNGLAAQYNRENCVWRRGNDRDSCPDPDVRVFLYTFHQSRRELDSRESDWLRQDYDPTKENVLLIHGYAGA